MDKNDPPQFTQGELKALAAIKRLKRTERKWTIFAAAMILCVLGAIAYAIFLY